MSSHINPEMKNINPEIMAAIKQAIKEEVDKNWSQLLKEDLCWRLGGTVVSYLAGVLTAYFYWGRALRPAK